MIPYPINDIHTTQIQLKLKNGGLGFRNSSNHHSAAYFSSINQCLPMVKDIFNASNQSSTDLVVSTNLLRVAEVDIYSRVPNDFRPLPFSQKLLSNEIDKLQFKALLSSSSAIDRARLLSISSPHATAFLSAIPSPKLSLSNEQFSVIIAYFLGLVIFPKVELCRAPNCSQKMDIFGHHAIRCGKKGDWNIRHNRIRDYIFNIASSALVEPVKEPLHLVRNCGMKCADVAIPNYPFLNMTGAIDFFITDPLRKDFIPHSSDIRGFAVNHYAHNVKEAKYSDLLAKDSRVSLVPFGIESFGAFNEAACSVISFLATHLTQRGGLKRSFSCVLQEIYSNISIILQRSNANIILSRMERVVV